MESYLEAIKEYEVTEQEIECLKEGVKEFGEEIDEEKLAVYYKIAMWACILDESKSCNQ